MWPDLTVYFFLGKISRLLWQICCITGLIFIVAYGQILKHYLTICSHWVRCSSRTIQFQPNWIIWWWLPRWFFNIELYSWLSIDWITVHAENTHLLCKGEYHCSPEGLPWYCMEPTKAEKSIVNFHVVKLAVTLETSRHRGMVLLPMVNALCRGALW